jgi:hypothetical protein
MTISLSSKIFNVQTAAFDNAFQCTNRNRFASVHGNNHLPSISVAPFLVTAGLTDEIEPVLPQNFDDVFCVANWKSLAHGSETSTSFAFLFRGISDGSNQRANASLAFSIASFSVSPAEAQPGNSGKTADHRLASASNSTNNRKFMFQN